MSSQTLLFRNAALQMSRRLFLTTTTRRSPSTSLVRVFSTAPQAAVEQHESESFLTGTSSIYAEQMYENYLQDPNSVEESWRRYFDNLSQGVAFNEAEFNQPTAVPPSKASKRQAPISAVRLYIIVVCHYDVCESCFSSHITHPIHPNNTYTI
jgi:hypothetical protein